MTARWETLLREKPGGVDALATLTLIGVLAAPWLLVPNVRDFAWSAALLVPLAWRRTRPTASFLAVYTAAAAHWVAIALDTTTLMPGDLAVPFSAYAISAYGGPRARRVGLWLGMGGALLAAIKQNRGPLISLTAMGFAFVVFGSTLISAWVLGALTRSRQRTLEGLRERARLLESERDQQARLAVAAERARIAREMHDVVAHSLAVMIAQADGGRYAAGTSPEAAQNALTTISRTGREALMEMRRLLGVLRDGDDGGGGVDVVGAALQPQSTLGDLPALLDTVRASGVAVDVALEGEPRDLPPGAQLAAYRIVQEALTNVLKHAGHAARVRVDLDWRDTSALHVRITDDGRGAAATPVPGRGQGLRGMAERVALYGGTVTAGPRAGGGFEVHATLRIEEHMEDQE